MAKPALVWFGLLLLLAVLVANASQQDCRNYNPDPHHLWNRLHEALFMREGPDGESYGHDRLDPLFWWNTKHLLTEGSHRKALGVLDEFLDQRGEKLIRDPLQRAFLQHDLWALFDWSTGPSGGEQYARQRKELQSRLATVIRRLALTKGDIVSLPDNYARAQASDTLASLPQGLFQRDGDWVNIGVGVNAGLVAPVHVSDFGGRSVVQILLRLPDGRPATLSYLEQLHSFKRPWIYVESAAADREQLVMNSALPQFPAGTQWALMRRMCVIDADGRIQPTSIVESIQVRRYLVVRPGIALSIDERANAQQVLKFVASRGQSGNLREVLEGERDFTQFRSVGVDPFEFHEERRVSRDASDFREWQKDVLKSCFQCHQHSGIHSVQSYTRIFGHPQWLRPPELIESDQDREGLETVQWKHRQYDFGLLQGLWERMN